MKLLAISVLASMLLSLGPFAALAEHEANHRYSVRGYVLDDERKPLADAPVSLRLGTEVVGSDRTDSDGYYSIRAHLHDSDIGKTLTLRAGEQRAEIRMQGEPGDLTTERIHHVNIVGGALVESELDQGGVPGWAYAAGALLLAGASIVGVRKLRRRSRRLQRQQARAANPKRKSKGKRKRRRR